MFNVFIDGQVGTTGLQIVQRLQRHSDIKLVEIPERDRKDSSIKSGYLNSSDVVILCLPDDAAREAVSLISDPRVKILDASTAHRVNEQWTYGLPELNHEQRNKIKQSRLVSVPGCYPTGFILAVAPLVASGIIPADYPITIQAVSGFSGGGRKLIESYQGREKTVNASQLWSYRPYALHLSHKHLPEMQKYVGLKHKPLFLPAVGHFHQGMLVMIPLFKHLLRTSSPLTDIVDQYQTSYREEAFINLVKANDTTILNDGFLSPTVCNETNRVDLMVFDNETQVLLIARLDNLGKGASGAAVQNLNLMLGIEETKGLL